MVLRTAILVDGAFYRKRAYHFFGDKSPKDRADELEHYCTKLLKSEHNAECFLYRVFYYDCPPSGKTVYHPATKKSVNLSKTDLYKWTNSFLQELTHRRKFALRLGRLSDEQAHYQIKPESLKKLLNKNIEIDALSEDDFSLSVAQKGVDMRIGIDISSLAFKKQVDRIILISGDSDFVPAAKQARREGIDFILDPMRAVIKSDLYEHIDGIRTQTPKEPVVVKPTSEDAR